MKKGWEKHFLYTVIILGTAVFLHIIIQTVKAKNTGFETKTLWDWMELLIIPVFLTLGAVFLNRSERNTEREIALDRQQEAALQSYLDRMADLLLIEKLRTTKKKEVREVARIRTLTVLRGLDTKRKGLVIKFLYGAKLINKLNPIINLEGANLAGSYLHFTELINTDLSYADLSHADLSNATLQGANLTGCNMEAINLKGAILTDANFNNAGVSANLAFAILVGATLRGANLQSVNLENADLRSANLENANLKHARLIKADLRGHTIELIKKASQFTTYRSTPGANMKNADLDGADLTKAKIIESSLKDVKSRQDITMPNGITYHSL